MSRTRANSSPDLIPVGMSNTESPDCSTLEGVAANVKLLLKLIQDQNEASTKDNDDRKTQRVAGMMTILDDVKTRIQKFQSHGTKREAELRRCFTELKPSHQAPRDKKPQDVTTDEKQSLRRELNASLAARKSLEIMCSSLGKEKEIMATELARKVHELNGMEELINDLKAQNETLLAKVQACAANHKEKKGDGGGDAQGKPSLHDRNKTLSEQLLKSLDGYRSLKRKLKETQEENATIRAKMEEIAAEFIAGVESIGRLRQRIAGGNDRPVDIEREISGLESSFDCLKLKDLKHGTKKSENIKPKAELKSNKPSVLA